jgi:2-methylcitrate dehydratase PrpD
MGKGMVQAHPEQPIAMILAQWIADLSSEELPDAVAKACANTVIDTMGLAIASRNTDYVGALAKAWTGPGPCTVIGTPDRLAPEAAAMINGTAAHGEDFDNTFEGCPVHPGAVIVPAVLAIAEAEGLSGADALRGIAVGQELMCRMGLVAQKGVHAAGFHPTAVIGAMGATAAVAAATRATPLSTANALGVAGSMASGIIEYLADGSWTKRMHAGWAAQSGLRAMAMGRAGFKGPATVFEGEHGFFHAFAPSVAHDFSVLTSDLGRRWETTRLAFKPFACGTMAQPFVDCAIRLAQRGIRANDIQRLECSVGEGTVHRLWEPLDLKRKPPTAYAAKFSTPYCIAVGFVRGDAGLAEFDERLIHDSGVLALSERVSYVADPADEYPRNYTGHIRATLTDGTVVEERQPHLRGGVRQPLERAELINKCGANIIYGGSDPALATTIAQWADRLPEDATMIQLPQL